MAKQQTEKSRFPSRYGGEDNFVTGTQYIIELICEKKAKLDNRNLPLKFWTHPDWAAFYKRWLRQVAKLLKEFDEKAIIAALKSKKSGMRWSLHTEFMLNLIREEQGVLDNKKDVEFTKIENYKDKEVTERTPNKTIQRLKDLD
jgi:hypothetical protein